MRILMIVTWYGQKNKDKFTGNFHRDLAKKIGEKHEVAIYFPFDNDIKEDFEYDYENNILVFRSKPSSSLFGKIKKIKKDFGIIQLKFKPELIHAHVTNAAGSIAMIINKIFRIPYIITEHMPIEMMRFNLFGKMYYRVITNCSMRNIAVSPDLRDKLNEIYKKSDFIYINNGVNDPIEILKNQNKMYRKSDYVNCALVGALYAKDIKGLQILLPAIKKIISEGTEIHLHICGGGKYLEYYENFTKKLKIEQNVTFYGMCEREMVFDIMKQMDFMISASLFESAGVSVEEACMLGKPQVITKSGGANSLIPDEFAIKVEKGSVEGLYTGIKKMICIYKKYDAEKIREYGLKEFSMHKVCEDYIRIYKEIVKNI